MRLRGNDSVFVNISPAFFVRVGSLRIILDSAVETVARATKALKIEIIFAIFCRRRSHPYGEVKNSKNNL